jgi:hypothetical protein
VEAVTAEASRFSIQTTITWEIADEPVPVDVAVGVGVGRADGADVGVGRAEGAAVARGEGAGVADGLAAGVGDGRADGVDDCPAPGVTNGRADGADEGTLEGRSSAELPDGLGALADGVSVANPAALAEAAELADAATPVGAVGLTGAGVAWHAASMAASPNVATARRRLIPGTACRPTGLFAHHHEVHAPIARPDPVEVDEVDATELAQLELPVDDRDRLRAADQAGPDMRVGVQAPDGLLAQASTA